MVAQISDMAAAVIFAMVEKPLRRRCSPSAGIHPESAEALMAGLEELRRAGGVWRASRRFPSAGTVAEMHPGSNLDMEIDTEKAAELLDLTTSRVRQLLRSGELRGGRKVGRFWLVKRSAVIAYRMPRRAAA